MAEIGQPAVRDWDFPRGTASVLLMSRFAEEHGVPATTVLRGTGIDGRVDADAQVDARQELAVVRNVVATVGGSDAVALDLGRRYHASTFGIFGFACVSSPTLRDAMAFALRYLDLSFTFSTPEVAVDGDRVVLTLHDERIPADVVRFLVLRDLAATHSVLRDILPGMPLRELQVRHDRPADPSTTDEYRRTFGLLPGFGAAANALALDVDYLDHPLPQADERTVAMCEERCRELVTRRRARSGVPHEVREQLIRVGGVDAGMDSVARELAMSPRTLRRRLSEAGTSYRALLDEVRQALAEEMLSTGALSVEAVAIRLGYAEASSFIHAFKRWKGCTPSAYLRRTC